jgi:hypothetical protein
VKVPAQVSHRGRHRGCQHREQRLDVVRHGFERGHLGRLATGIDDFDHQGLGHHIPILEFDFRPADLAIDDGHEAVLAQSLHDVIHLRGRHALFATERDFPVFSGDPPRHDHTVVVVYALQLLGEGSRVHIGVGTPFGGMKIRGQKAEGERRNAGDERHGCAFTGVLLSSWATA